MSQKKRTIESVAYQIWCQRLLARPRWFCHSGHFSTFDRTPLNSTHPVSLTTLASRIQHSDSARRHTIHISFRMSPLAASFRLERYISRSDVASAVPGDSQAGDRTARQVRDQDDYMSAVQKELRATVAEHFTDIHLLFLMKNNAIYPS